MSDDAIFLVGLFVLLILCMGDPDLLDALISNLMSGEAR